MSSDPRDLLQALGRQSIPAEVEHRALERKQKVTAGLLALDGELRHKARERRRLALLGPAIGFAAATAVGSALMIRSASVGGQGVAPAVTAPMPQPRVRRGAPSSAQGRPVASAEPPARAAESNSADTAQAKRATPAGAAPGATHARESALSTLAQENELLAGAKFAARHGDFVRSLAALDELLSRYPRSPLRQNADVERFRVLGKMGQKAEAARAARRYLADYPHGFARDEAQALAVD